jgi:uncharacterized lipoprotein NlpE involved in copper resistance
MKRVLFIPIIITLAFLVCAYASDREPPAMSASAVEDMADNSRNSLDWEGVYTGIIPEDGGPGIKVSITLHYDLTYAAQYQYIGRHDQDVAVSGTFAWDEGGRSIILDMDGVSFRYLVGENMLIQMGMTEEPIAAKLTGYVLTKE